MYLSWKYHINHVAKKVSKSIGIISKARFFLSSKSLLSLYLTIHRFTRILIPVIAWCSTYPSHFNRILYLQKRIARIICGAEFLAHTAYLDIFNIKVFRPWRNRSLTGVSQDLSRKKKRLKKLRYFWLPPHLAHRKLIDLANYVHSFRPREVLSFTQRFFKMWEMVPQHAMYLWLLLLRMKACIDEFQPNTSQANYCEGFWRITSKKTGKSR